MGGIVCGLVQPPAPPQRHQVRHAPPASQRSGRGDLPSPSCRLRAGPRAQSTALDTNDPLLASAGGGLDQPTVIRNRTRTSYLDDGCLNGRRGVIFPGSHRSGSCKHLSQRMRARDSVFCGDVGEQGTGAFLLAAHPLSDVRPFSRRRQVFSGGS